MEFLLPLAGLALAQAVAVVSPGPSFVIVVRTALARSPREALWVTLGLGFGTVFWAGAALFGLALLFAAVPWLYLGLRIAGACYLLWMAFMLWRHASTPLELASSADGSIGGAGAALRSGLLTQLANPKVAVFFGSIFVTFLPEAPTLAFRLTALATAFLIEIGWYALVSVAFARASMRERYLRARHLIDRIAGTVLAGLGVRLAFAP